MTNELKQLTEVVIERINTMSNRSVSYSNVNFLFKRNYDLHIFAIECIDTLEDKGIDSRALSIAFSNAFSDHERCLDDESILENGKYIIDVPPTIIQRAMLWLTEHVVIATSFRADVGKVIPRVALQSNSAFDKFLRGISGHDNNNREI